jgi:hypothetical protein
MNYRKLLKVRPIFDYIEGMTHQINGVVLFVSSVSNACADVMRYVMANKLNVNVVRLDTAEDRMRALTGKYVQVDTVPTMVVIFKDDTIQKFLGAEKILGWMSNIVKGVQASEISQPSPSTESQPVPSHPKSPTITPKTKTKSKKSKSRKHKVVEHNSEEEIDIDFGEMEEEHEPLPPPPPPQPSRRRGGKGGRLAQPPPPQRGDGEEITPEYVAAQQKLKGLMVNASEKKITKSTMSSVAEMARKMQEERKATLGYGEEHAY